MLLFLALNLKWWLSALSIPTQETGLKSIVEHAIQHDIKYIQNALYQCH